MPHSAFFDERVKYKAVNRRALSDLNTPAMLNLFTYLVIYRRTSFGAPPFGQSSALLAKIGRSKCEK